MKRRRFTACFVSAVLAVVGLASSAAAGETIPFKGSLEGTFITVQPIPNSPIATLVASGSGTAAPLGKFTFTFPHLVDVATRFGSGTCTLKTYEGDTVSAEIDGQATPTATPGVYDVLEAGTITGGTGRFSGATGEFTIQRRIDQHDGTTGGSFDGTITLPGAGK
jgi:hypothetical protein